MKSYHHQVTSQFILLLFLLLIFSLPFNLFYKFSEQGSYVAGLQIDYLIFKIYLVDILIIILWLSLIVSLLIKVLSTKLQETSIFSQKQDFKLRQWFLNLHITKNIKKFVKKNQRFMPSGLIMLAIIIRQLFAANSLIGLFFVAQICLVFLFSFLLKKNPSLLQSAATFWATLAAYLLQLGLGIFQFFTQKPLLPYYYLGEPSFTPYYRLSRYIFAGQEKILAYGSTAHPNILATVATLFFLLIAAQLNQNQENNCASHKVIKSKIFSISLTSFLFITTISLIYLTQAKTVLITLVLGCLYIWKKQLGIIISFKTKKIICSLTLLLAPVLLAILAQQHVYEPSIVRRHLLNTSAIKMIVDQPFLGQGLNQFGLALNNFNYSNETIRFHQPAHHVLLLWLAETGLLGLLLTAGIYRALKPKVRRQLLSSLFIVCPILAMDHFFYTLQPGRFLLIFFIFYWTKIFQTKNNPQKVSKK